MREWADCGQNEQQLFHVLHTQGRQGLHRHALMTMIAYAFLQHRRLAKAEGGKKNPRATTATKLPAVRNTIVNLMLRSPPH